VPLKLGDRVRDVKSGQFGQVIAVHRSKTAARFDYCIVQLDDEDGEALPTAPVWRWIKDVKAYMGPARSKGL